MTSPEPLGPRYGRRNIVLSKRMDWTLSIYPTDAAGAPLTSFGWAEGTEVDLVLGDLDEPLAVWPAAVTSNLVHWKVEAEDADLIPEGTELRVRITFPTTPTTELPWWKGKAKRDD